MNLTTNKTDKLHRDTSVRVLQSTPYHTKKWIPQNDFPTDFILLIDAYIYYISEIIFLSIYYQINEYNPHYNIFSLCHTLRYDKMPLIFEAFFCQVNKNIFLATVQNDVVRR